MKNKHVLLLAALLMVSFIVHSQTKNESRSLRDFNSVKISNSIEAELIKGDKNYIDIVASGIDLDKVETNISDGTLEVKLGRGNFKSNSVKVTVIYVDLVEIQASTSAKVFVKDPLEYEEVFLSASTSSYIEVQVDADVVYAEANTSARIILGGSANDLNLKVFTSAEVDGSNFQVQNAEVRANTASKSEFNVSETIKGNASTGARITFVGDPRVIDVNTNTGGSIKAK